MYFQNLPQMFESFICRVMFHKITLFSSIFAYITNNKTAFSRFKMLHKFFLFFFVNISMFQIHFIILYLHKYRYSFEKYIQSHFKKSSILRFMYIRECNHNDLLEKKHDINETFCINVKLQNGSMTKKKDFTIMFYYPIIVGSYNALDFSLKKMKGFIIQLGF